MNAVYRLQGEPDFIKITDNEIDYYGGDQAWFGHLVGQNGGCGTVAAADLTAYLACHHEAARALYPYESMSKSNFTIHMEQIFNYVKPYYLPFVSRNLRPVWGFKWTLGVWPARRLISGVQRYAARCGVSLTTHKISYCKEIHCLCDFIRFGLEQNTPVLMLIGLNTCFDKTSVIRPDGAGWQQDHFGSHWVVITELRLDGAAVMVKVSTWGGYAYLDLSKWQRNGGWPQKLVFFNIENTCN